MCELFGMSARLPATVGFSLEEFARHGGATNNHEDGWGIAFFEGNDVQVIREAKPAARSAALRFIRTHAYRSKLVIAHLRYATEGEPRLHNTQPFFRELGGTMHAFAHNGDLKGIRQSGVLRGGRRFQPLGATDSEYAFCCLMQKMEPIWQGEAYPTLEIREAVVRVFAEWIRDMGPANFIYSDGLAMFAHGHRREYGNGKGFRPPGLYCLRRCCDAPAPGVRLAGFSMEDVGDRQRVVLVASVPLSDEPWRPLEEGEILISCDGGAEGCASPE
ncbi:MAG: class II glutamine amidotransferase [Gammaproteobacteria bacterium]|jgi:glutamine amidotransferase|nr:class II glutamine amidotransferase [Gammaproteobacteria bacterium]